MEKQKLFLSSHVEVVEIDDEKYTFRPLRVRALMTARDVIKELTKSMSALLDPSEDDYVEREYIQSDDGGSKTTTKAISLELAEHRVRRQDQQWGRAVDSLLSETHMLGVATIIVDSMREEEVEPQELVDNVDLPRLTQLLRGVFLANTKVFGPLPGKVKAALDKATRKVTDRVAGASGGSPELESTETS